jgi:hypothetical protein
MNPRRNILYHNRLNTSVNSALLRAYKARSDRSSLRDRLSGEVSREPSSPTSLRTLSRRINDNRCLILNLLRLEEGLPHPPHPRPNRRGRGGSAACNHAALPRGDPARTGHGAMCIRHPECGGNTLAVRRNMPWRAEGGGPRSSRPASEGRAVFRPGFRPALPCFAMFRPGFAWSAPRRSRGAGIQALVWRLALLGRVLRAWLASWLCI